MKTTTIPLEKLKILFPKKLDEKYIKLLMDSVLNQNKKLIKP